MGKYKMTRIPIDVWEQWMGKKRKIEERIKLTRRKEVKVPLTHVLRFYGKQQRFEWDDNIIPYFIKKQRRKLSGEVI